MIAELIPDKLTQGTIFSCARSDIYPGPVHGLIITARCDVAHGKNDSYAFLPIIALHDWAMLDGALITARRTASASIAVLEDILDKSELAKSILDKISHADIGRLLKEKAGKDAKKRFEKFEANATYLARCNAALTNRDRPSLEKILKDHPQIFKGVYKDLHSNAMSDFHFLPRLTASAPSEGYVLSLREVRHLSRNAARKVEEGFDSTQLATLETAERETDKQLCFSPEADFAMPISQVRSPETELIMQRFTQLFSRIGVDDLSKDDIDTARDNLATILEIRL